jgi:hypothetical protein
MSQILRATVRAASRAVAVRGRHDARARERRVGVREAVEERALEHAGPARLLGTGGIHCGAGAERRRRGRQEERKRLDVSHGSDPRLAQARETKRGLAAALERVDVRVEAAREEAIQ